MRKYLFILLCLLATACHEPGSQERFIKGTGPFVFQVNMSDTTAVYDMDIYTREDSKEILPMMELWMRWTSPSDSSFRETVFLPLSTEVYTHYRADVTPFEPGVWTLTVTAPSARLIHGLRGLGLVVKKRVWDTEN